MSAARDSRFPFFASAVDRFWLRLWWWAEGRAMTRIEKRWPVEFQDVRRDGKPRADWLTEAHQALVIDRV